MKKMFLKKDNVLERGYNKDFPFVSSFVLLK